MRENNKRNILPHASWGAIAAGAILALAIQFMLGLLGAGLGLVNANFQDGVDMSAFGWGAGIWIALTFFISLFAGGFAAARLSFNTQKYAGSINSLVVWSLVVALNIFAAGKGVSGMAGTLSSAVSNSTGFITNTLNIEPPTESFAGIDFQNLQEEIDQLLQESDNEELKSLVEKEYQEIKGHAAEAAQDILTRPGRIDQTVENFANDAQASLRDIRSQVDREDLAQIVSTRSELSEQEAQAAIERWQTKITQWSQNFEAQLQEAQEEVMMQAQEAADTSGQMALVAFFTLLLGMVSAFIGGRLGTSRTRNDYDE